MGRVPGRAEIDPVIAGGGPITASRRGGTIGRACATIGRKVVPIARRGVAVKINPFTGTARSGRRPPPGRGNGTANARHLR
ncbi:hypothetical protein GCM10027271_09340 [Saccharopolyspora gloriosae]